MTTHLNHIQKWPELAKQAKWSASALAKSCGVSIRTLERHFLKEMGTKPKTWMIEQRQRQAMEMLRDGASVKETASLLGYKHSHHLSREFKAYFGFSPTIDRQSRLKEQAQSHFGTTMSCFGSY